VKIIALIPARAGSKGVPNKNIRPLGGHPLIGWSIAVCASSKYIDEVIVSTDSAEYAEIANNYGAKTPFLRPSELSWDKSTDIEFVIHALEWFASHSTLPDYVVHIRPTTPFRTIEIIDAAIDVFLNSENKTALRSVQLMSESAYKTFEISDEGLLRRLGNISTDLDIANNARQEFPATYIANGYVDVLSTSFILKNNLLHGNKVLPFITPRVNEVDTEEDFNALEIELIGKPHFLNNLFINK